METAITMASAYGYATVRATTYTPFNNGYATGEVAEGYEVKFHTDDVDMPTVLHYNDLGEALSDLRQMFQDLNSEHNDYPTSAGITVSLSII